jgi:hypothetical protein
MQGEIFLRELALETIAKLERLDLADDPPHQALPTAPTPSDKWSSKHLLPASIAHSCICQAAMASMYAFTMQTTSHARKQPLDPTESSAYEAYRRVMASICPSAIDTFESPPSGQAGAEFTNNRSIRGSGNVLLTVSAVEFSYRSHIDSDRKFVEKRPTLLPVNDTEAGCNVLWQAGCGQWIACSTAARGQGSY